MLRSQTYGIRLALSRDLKQGLLGSPEAKDLPPDLLDAGRESFFGSYQFLAASR